MERNRFAYHGHLCIVGIGILILLVTAIPSVAQEVFDYSEYQTEIDRLGIPNEESVQSLRLHAVSLFESEQYLEAVDALDEWARSANWLANIIRQGLEPYYRTPSSSRPRYNSRQLNELVARERLSNHYIGERNLAMVMRAESLLHLGRPDEALAVFSKVLDLLRASEQELWMRATAGLYSIIGLDPIDL